jgi:formate hydrogenlyase subunit 6/NADH:ubiquinone oxidoreductase subunit I
MSKYQLTYSQLLKKTIVSMMVGLKLTLKHFVGARHKRAQVGVMDKSYFKQPDGIVTNQYPFEQLPIPDNGRYKLHNEIDDCIVCDLCAKICPVNCIEIDPIKSPVEIGKTSDGSTKRIYAATFNIDMAKCCFCGLCTTVCPTECLTMTQTFDFSEFNVSKLTYAFAELSKEEAEVKRQEYEVFAQQEKEKKANKATVKTESIKTTDAQSQESASETKSEIDNETIKPKVVVPKIKPVIPVKKTSEGEPIAKEESQKPALPKLKPIIPSVKNEEGNGEPTKKEESKPAALPPKLKPVIPSTKKESNVSDIENKTDEVQKAITPKLKPVIPALKKDPSIETEIKTTNNEPIDESVDQKPKPVVPKLKPVIPKRIPPKEDTNNE